MDTECEIEVRKMSSRLPAERLLTTEQRRIVEMLAEHLRNLKPIPSGESAYSYPEYTHVNVILTQLFKAKFPHWTKRALDGCMDLDGLPRDAHLDFERLFRNCGGRYVTELGAAEAAADLEDD